jgi:hypothetical protein
MSKTNIDEVKLGGAKRKNGHKSDCTCHICENMKNKAKRGGYEEEVKIEEEKMMGGSKKKNGHRKDCKCPICKNMKNAKKGGNDNNEESENAIDFEKEQEEESIDFAGGKKKKGNGHKRNCMCPICKNMRKAKKGGEDPENNVDGEITNNVDGEITNNVDGEITNNVDGEITNNVNEKKATDEEYDSLDSLENTNGNISMPAAGGSKNKKWGGKKWGGKTKRRKNKSMRARRTRRRNISRKHH